MTKKKTAMQMVEEANAVIETVALQDAAERQKNDTALFVDIRDIRELWREGTIPGALSAPRGMLEFWFDPTCKYFKPELADDRKIVLFCASAWRSALAAKDLQDMGFDHIAHLEGGFSAWKAAGLEIQPVRKR